MTQDDRNIAFPQGPFLSAAFLCETVLREASGVTSAIRIVDRINHGVVGPELRTEMAPFEYSLFLYLALKSGSARGPMELIIRLEDPSVTSKPIHTQTINFEGDDERGSNIIAELRLQLSFQGLHWFDVFLDGVRITRIPLRVVYLPQIRQAPPGPPGSGQGESEGR